MFGGFKYNGKFHVLRGDVPLILGMDFLASASPSVDWKGKKVTCFVGVRKFDLPTCEIGDVDTQCDDNSFAGLSVDDGAVHVPSSECADLAEKADVAIGESCSVETSGAENCPVKGKKRVLK